MFESMQVTYAYTGKLVMVQYLTRWFAVWAYNLQDTVCQQLLVASHQHVSCDAAHFFPSDP